MRRMDWGVTARTTEPHVRDLVADRELETWALVDASASMDFGTARAEKRDLAVAAVAAVGFLTAGTGNRLGAYVLRPGGLRLLPARPGRPALLGLVRALLTEPRNPPGSRPADRRWRTPSTALSRRHRRRGLRVIVSDFLDDGPGLGASRCAGSPPGTRCSPSRSSTRASSSCPDVGLLAVVDPETGRRREVWTGRRAAADRYAEAAAAHRLAVRDRPAPGRRRHLVLRTDRDWVRDVARFATDQRRRARTRRPSAPGPHRSAS